MHEQLAYEHLDDLRRAAAAHRRVAARADRARPRPVRRAADRLRAAVTHRPVRAVGCQA